MLGAATLLIGAVALPLWRPLLIAAVLAGVLSPLYERRVRRMRRPALARAPRCSPPRPSS